MFGEQVTFSLGIPAVSYDLAAYRGVYGVVTPNYNPMHVKEIQYLLTKKGKKR